MLGNVMNPVYRTSATGRGDFRGHFHRTVPKSPSAAPSIPV